MKKNRGSRHLDWKRIKDLYISIGKELRVYTSRSEKNQGSIHLDLERIKIGKNQEKKKESESIHSSRVIHETRRSSEVIRETRRNSRIIWEIRRSSRVIPETRRNSRVIRETWRDIRVVEKTRRSIRGSASILEASSIPFSPNGPLDACWNCPPIT
ncbi:hypothetical protein H5410_057949 [Solanum commersonii]|uniref:Uncharacterized protein n=1 Tax=Solanum commersonii TaxID=4109 RepID=A0A9J5WRG0_SOLCO|nr:hypothetical protein H5410_057949 [Solanum commersonii]